MTASPNSSAASSAASSGSPHAEPNAVACDATLRELGTIVLTLRRDVTPQVRPTASTTTYLLEDETAGRFYRVGEAEYVFCSLLDGRRTFADVFAQAAATSGAAALTEQAAAGLCQWLVETGLAFTEASRVADRLQSADDRTAAQQRRSRRNPLFLKMPLGNPDGLFRLLAPLLGWLTSPLLFLVWLPLGVAGAIAAALTSQRLHGGHTLSAADGWWVAGIWLLLRLVHEGAHGVAARRLGCEVRKWGLTWVLLVPLPYVDITSAWRLDRRRDRMLIAGAGMTAELVVAALAALVWASTSPGPLHVHALHVMISASVVTLLFNANPLMRFDGYHLLADAVELPNLAGHGQQAVRSLGRRWALGLDGDPPKWPEGRGGFVLVYGLAALVWRLVLAVSLIVAAETLLAGAGVLLALVAAATWLVWPTLRLVGFVARGSKTERPSRLRFAGVVLAVGGLLVAAAALPWAPAVEAHGVYDFDPVVEVRSEAGGFVVRIDVQPGQTVSAGQSLATLSNPDLEAERGELAVAIATAEQRMRQFRESDEIAAFEVQRHTRTALLDRLATLDARLATRHLVAPVAGVVLGEGLPDVVGRYLAAGQPLLEIGPAKRRLIVLVPAAERDRVEPGQSVSVHVWGRGLGRTAGVVERLDPAASTRLPHPALAASAGGPLPVRQLSQEEAELVGESVRLLRPHAAVRVRLVDPPSQAGRLAHVTFGGPRQRLGPHVLATLADWFDTRHR